MGRDAEPRIWPLPWLIIGLGLVVVAALWATLSNELDHDRRQVQRSAEVNATNLARAFEAHVLSTASLIDHALLHIRDEIEHDPADLQQEVARVFATLDSQYLLQIATIDADGMLGYSSLGTPDQPLDLSDREHYRVHRDATEDRLFISRPVLGRVSGRWSVQFTRRMRSADGGFGGVLVISVDPAYFTDFYQSIDIGRDGAVTLVGTDRVIRARASKMPAPREAMNFLVPDRPYFHDDQPRTGTYEVPSAVDGVLRIGAWRRLTEYPLVVVVLLSRSEVFADFEDRRATLVAWTGALSVVLLGAFGLLAWAVERNRRTHARLAERTDELAGSNAELQAFAYAASHDLREPLRMVSSFLSLLERRAGPKLDEEEREFIGFARDGARRMDRLVLDLLEYSRAGRKEAPFERVALAEAVDSALSNLRTRIEESGAAVVVAPDLPDVAGHPDELSRLFQNLIANALKYRDPDRRLMVRIDAQRFGTRVLVAVRDNGIGIAPEHQERVFALFERLHSRGHSEGTGIGLALCRKIMAHHKGRIWVDSAPGEGSTFVLGFPATYGGRGPCDEAVLRQWQAMRPSAATGGADPCARSAAADPKARDDQAATPS